VNVPVEMSYGLSAVTTESEVDGETIVDNSCPTNSVRSSTQSTTTFTLPPVIQAAFTEIFANVSTPSQDR